LKKDHWLFGLLKFLLGLGATGGIVWQLLNKSIDLLRESDQQKIDSVSALLYNFVTVPVLFLVAVAVMLYFYIGTLREKERLIQEKEERIKEKDGQIRFLRKSTEVDNATVEKQKEDEDLPGQDLKAGQRPATARGSESYE